MKSRIVLLIMLMFFGGNSNAQWVAVNTGITNLDVIPMAEIGNNLFAGTFGGGVFLSTNNGTSWTAVNTGLTDLDIFSMTVHGTNLYAGTYGGGVFMSSNNGTSWTAVNNGITNMNVYALASSGSNVYAGTVSGGVFLSTNNGVSWTAVNTGLSNLSVVTLFPNGSDLFAGTAGGGAFISSNNGTSWTAVNTGLTSTTVRSFTASGSNLYAGTSGAGIFLSTNNGTSWTAVNTGLTTTTVWALTAVGTDILAGTNGGGVFLSSNNGASWAAVNTGLTASPDVWSVAVSGTNVYVGINGNAGVFRRPLSELGIVTNSISYGATTYCANVMDPTPTISGSTGGVFSSTAGLIINSATGEIDLSASTPGSYIVTYTLGGSPTTTTVTITDIDDASFSYASTDYCTDGVDPIPTISGLPGGTFTSLVGLVTDGSTGEIDLSASTPGLYLVSYFTNGACPSSSDVVITISAPDDASFTYDASNYCKNGSDPTPTISGASGGTFSAVAGLSLNATTGEVDLDASTPGIYTVNYTTNGTCSNTSFVNIMITEVDVSTTLSGLTISANTTAVGVSYQWLDCVNGMSVIAGETNSSFTATANGNYAVEVSENGCIDTSACTAISTIGLVEFSISENFNVYPNPTEGEITIKFDHNQSDLTVHLYSLTGKLIQSRSFYDSDLAKLQIDEASGMYILKISDENGNSSSVRVVKK